MPIKLNIPLPSKGLVVDRPSEYVDQRASSNTRNMEFNRGIIRKRAGSSDLGATMGERCMRLFELQVGEGTRLIRLGLTKIQDYAKTSQVWSDISSTPLTGSADDAFSVAYPTISGQKVAVFTNGIDPLRKVLLTGDNQLLGGSPPIAKFVKSFGPYLVLGYITAGGNTFYNRVQWCDTGDPELWSGGNAGSVELLEDPDDITGFGLFGNFITVHKSTSIYLGQLVTTSDVFRFDRKSTGIGCVAEGTVANIPTGEQIFLGTDGIHIFNGITAPLIDAPIQEELRETINPAAVKRSTAVIVDELDEYWVAVPIGSDTEPSTIYKYNWRTGQVYRDDRNNCTALSLYLNTDAETWGDAAGTWGSQTKRWDSASSSTLNKVVIFGDSDGLVQKREPGLALDGTSPIDSILDTKDFTSGDFGISDIDIMMRWKGIKIWAIGNSLKIECSMDSGATWLTANTLTLGSSYPLDSNPTTVYFDYVSSSLMIRFSNNVVGESFTIKKYMLLATPREERK
jgi:hypothetical protein